MMFWNIITQSALFLNCYSLYIYIYLSAANNDPCIIWRKPNIEMLVDFLNLHQHWEPSYIRKMMFPMMSTIFFRDITTTTMVETLLFGQYGFDCVKRVKTRYGYQFYVVKWKHARANIACKVPSKESSVQHDVVELDETVDQLDDCDVPEIHEDDEGCFLFTDENMDLVEAAFPTEVQRFRQEQVIIFLFLSLFLSNLFLIYSMAYICFCLSF